MHSLSENESARLLGVPRRRMIVYGLILLGGAMRLTGVGAKCLWVDEIDSVFVSQDIERLMDYCREGHTPPLRYLLVWALQKGPRPESCIRLPAVILGTLSIPLMLWIGQMLWNWRAGAVAAVLLLLSPWHLLHSQDARYYSVMLFLALAAMGLAVRIIQEPRPLWRWVILALVCAVNLYISYVTIFPALAVGVCLAACGLWQWWRSRGRGENLDAVKWIGRGLAVAGVVGLLALSPWLSVMFGVFGKYVEKPADSEEVKEASEQAAVQRVLLWRTEYDWSYANEYLAKLGLEQSVAKWALLVFFVAGLVAMLHHNRPFVLMTVLWFGLPWPVILNTGIQYFLPPRYLIHYLGLYILLCGIGLVAVWEVAKRLVVPESDAGRVGKLRRVLFYAATAAAVAAALAAYAYEDYRYFRTEKQDWKAVVRLLDQNVQPGEPVLAGASWSDLGLRYYGKDLKRPLMLIRQAVAPHQIESQMAIYRRVWYVTWGRALPETQELLDRRFQLVRSFPGLEGPILVYASKSAKASSGG